MKKKLNILEPDPEIVREIYRTLRCHPATARILANRDLRSTEDISRFLSPSLKQLRDPFSIVDMRPAVDRIARAIYRREKVLIFGDYDVDGVTSTVLLHEFLKKTGAHACYYIPHRLSEGYGLKAGQIEKIIDSFPGLRLIVTVDCGSHSQEAVEAARQAGIDVVVTDHHIAPANLPDALAVVNPKREDCASGLDHLAGVGVVFYLIIALRMHLRKKGFWSKSTEPNLKQLCDLVALGTVADLVPLRHENRVLVKTGLEILQNRNRPGLKALSKSCRFFRNAVDSEDIAFRLAPRLNAAGRIEHADTAARLLMAEQDEESEALAQFLDELNERRKELERTVFDEAMECIRNAPGFQDGNALVLASPDWHEGVLGIVASRIVEKYFRPAVLIASRDGYGKGSCRSIPGFDLFDGLCRCQSLLVDFGGHSMAAGLKIKNADIDRFRDAFQKVFDSEFRKTEIVPELTVDCELSFDDISEPFIDELESLKPFGAENPEPVFLARDIQVSEAKIVGERHRRMLLSQPGGKTGKKLNAIHFNIDPDEEPEDFLDYAVFKLRWNRWNGTKTAQILVTEIGT